MCVYGLGLCIVRRFKGTSSNCRNKTSIRVVNECLWMQLKDIKLGRQLMEDQYWKTYESFIWRTIIISDRTTD